MVLPPSEARIKIEDHSRELFVGALDALGLWRDADRSLASRHTLKDMQKSV
jgi:hypothetical protein